MTKPGEKFHETSDGQCTRNLRSTGERCKHRVKPGAIACHLHGGNLPPVKRGAQLRLARDKAQQEAIKRLKADRAPKADMITEMDRLAAEVIVFKDVCRERLDELLVLPEGIRYEGKTGEQLRAEVALYERALDRCNTVLATNVKLGIAEKKASIDQAHALIVVGVVKAILNRLNLSRDQKIIAGQVVPEELRAISAAVAAD